MTTNDRLFLGTLMASYIRVLKADRDKGLISKSQYHARLAKARDTERSILTSNF